MRRRTRLAKSRVSDRAIFALAIATVCASALVLFAAHQTPADRRVRRPRLSRAQINAAEERAIWTNPVRTVVEDGGRTITVTGCVENGNDHLRLTDVAGDEAPRARSWKSGFFRNGTVPLDVAQRSAGLVSRHAGARVRVTGTLDGHDLTVRSLRRIDDSC